MTPEYTVVDLARERDPEKVRLNYCGLNPLEPCQMRYDRRPWCGGVAWWLFLRVGEFWVRTPAISDTAKGVPDGYYQGAHIRVGTLNKCPHYIEEPLVFRFHILGERKVATLEDQIDAAHRVCLGPFEPEGVEVREPALTPKDFQALRSTVTAYAEQVVTCAHQRNPRPLGLPENLIFSGAWGHETVYRTVRRPCLIREVPPK